jgi:phage shock protein PspC (stress-responsive transcriptional regulator)
MNQFKRKLYRSGNKIIGGVAAGLAEYFEIDPILVRIVFVVLALINPPLAVIIYLILMIFMPRSGVEHSGPEGTDNPGENNPANWGRKNLMGLVFVVVGLLLLAQQFFPLRWFKWDVFWPVVIILVGFYILSKKRHGRN